MKLKDAVIPIIVANILIFLLQIFVKGLTENFMLVSSDVLARPWILVTSMFLHGSPAHLLFNMYVLFIFGPLIQQRIGAKRFLIIYFLSGILASLFSVPFYDAALGASGAIMGILGVTIVLLPNLKVLFFFFIPMSLRTAGIIIAIIDLLGVFYPSGTANIAHLVGLACGLIYGYMLLKRRKGFAKRFSGPRRKTGIDLDDRDVDDYIRYGRI